MTHIKRVHIESRNDRIDIELRHERQPPCCRHISRIVHRSSIIFVSYLSIDGVKMYAMFVDFVRAISLDSWLTSNGSLSWQPYSKICARSHICDECNRCAEWQVLYPIAWIRHIRRFMARWLSSFTLHAFVVPLAFVLGPGSTGLGSRRRPTPVTWNNQTKMQDLRLGRICVHRLGMDKAQIRPCHALTKYFSF